MSITEKNMKCNKKVLIWGIGKIASRIEPHLRNVDIIGYIETVKSQYTYNGRNVYMPNECPKGYDLVLIAVSSGCHGSIFNSCKLNGIEHKRICAVCKSDYVTDIDQNLKLAKEIFTDEMYENLCQKFGQVVYDWVAEDAKKYEAMNTRETMRIREEYQYPIFTDKFAQAGGIDSYFWQDLWAARKIYEKSPEQHYDIGSRVDGFISHLLSFRRNINLIDIRPLVRSVDGLNFIQSDATSLKNIADNSIESLSALCSLEHFGLGRYGDPVDPDACYKCFDAISRKVKQGGDIYLSVPIGKEHVEFNAHRVFYASTIAESFSKFELIEFSSTCNGYIEYNVELNKYDEEASFGGRRFGLFHLRKK